MPASRLRLRILDRDYTLDAPANTHLRLKEAARHLDGLMRAQQAQDPAADATQLAVLAALEWVNSPAMSSLHERDIAKSLSALQRKLDRLDAAMSIPSPALPDDATTNPTKN